ncbi:MAG: carboxy terminal-processing peptidase [Flavobacteriaceae bacterium]|nr:carboxy terminal-processing peptidase [Flavobacteriaceae bacterium]
MNVLKKNFKVLFLAIAVSIASCSFTTKEFNDPDKDKLLIDLITFVLQKGHYNPKDMNDEFSKNVYDNFLEGMDPLKRYFLTSDIEDFSQYQYELDDQIKVKDLTFFNLVYTRYNKRLEDVKKIYPEVLEIPFDYYKDEEINVDYEEVPYTTSRKELKERWRKQLKFSTISNYYDLIEDNGMNVKNNDKEITSEPKEPKSLKEIEEESRESSKTSLDEYFNFVDDLERKDYFAIFLNILVEEFDPHTNYFAPTQRDRFDMQMSGKLEGIGARLQKKNDYIKIVEVISGGPAWRGEHVEVGDQIMKVRQEDEKEAVSVVGMRLDDAVKLIKGPKGTKVTLTLKRVDGSIEDETIVRDVVELEETYAKSTLINKDGKNFGLINLPQFYFDMDNYKERNAASDVKKEIIRLKKEGMEGLIIDLRNNGGGSLRTAVEMAGLFIKEGPVVQVASSGSKKEVLKDRDKGIEWEGPLVILVNELSASASEILAAAMQDYKRAIIIGSKQSYGKGTVQNLLDLNQWLRKNDMGDMGALKLTTQKFYRVNGGSTQLEGVKSDVVMPDRYSYIDIGERDYDNPLPYDKIDAADYDVWNGYIDYEETIKKSNARMAKSEQLKLIDENARWIKTRRDENTVTLNYIDYKADIEQRKEETKKFDAIDEYDNKLSYKSLPYEIKLMKQDTTLTEKRKRWHKALSKDIYVEEAVHVLEDLTISNIKNSKIVIVKD